MTQDKILATIRAAAESDGVIPYAVKVEAMARAMRPVLECDNDIYWASERGRPVPQSSLDALASCALNALRALEGE